MRGLVVLAALVALIVVGRQLRGLVPGFERYLEELGGLAGVLFVVGYVVATVAFVPGSILTMAAGALFGLTTGVALVFVAATIGSTLSFLIAKLAGDVATLAGSATPPGDTGYYLVLSVGLGATIVVTTLVTRMARAALRTATEDVAG